MPTFPEKRKGTRILSKKFKAVLFDYDGTLIDTNQLIVDSWNHMYKKHFGGTLTGDDVKWTFGMLLSDAVDEQMKRMGHSGYDLAEIVESYREFQRGENATPAPPFEGMPELIAQLKERGVLLGIVTSRAQETLMKGLEKYGLKDSFGFIVCAETTQIHKPRPEPALICCKGLGVAPQDALMVGDSVFDLQCGNAAGCASAFVTWSFATSREKALREGHPTYIIDRPGQLLELV